MSDQNSRFSWKISEELPVDKSTLQFPRNPKDCSKDYVVQITPITGDEWVGNFIGIDKNYFSGVLLWPLENKLCIVARGTAYVVNVENPDEYEELPVVPIIDAYSMNNIKIVIFVTFWEIYAFGENGMLWGTNDLALDGIEITKITNDSIFGISKSYEKDITFTIDIKTGKTKEI